jgi:agmatine/peptidylarginine deiminase
MRPEPCRTNDPETQEYIRSLQRRFANDTNIIILDSSIPMPGTEDITAETLWPTRHLPEEARAKIREEAEREANEYENGSRNSMFMVNPPLPVWRSVAEWEEHDAVMIAVRAPNIIGVPFEFLACITNDRPGSPGREVHFMGPLGAQTNIINLMIAAGANMSRVVYLQNHSTHTSSIWTRDFGPLFSVLEDGSVFMADFIYQRTWNVTPNLFGREGDQNVHTYATAKGWEHGVAFGRHAHAGHEGGNHMTDGIAGGVFKSTSGVRGVGAGNDLVAARVTLTNWFGVSQHWIYDCPISTPFVPNSPWGGIQHVDCYAKFLRPDIMFISSVPNHTSAAVILAGQNTDAMAANHKLKTSSYGTLMKVERAIAPSMQPYANTWIMNNRVYVPIGPWNSPGTIFPHPPVDWQQVDANMIQMLANNMPGYIIIGVPNATALPWRNEDALHCRVKEIARRDVVHVVHTPVRRNAGDTAPVVINAIIRSAPQAAALAPNTIRVHYRLNFNEWTSVQMTLTNAATHTYSATISGISSNSQLFYYIRAEDTTGRFTMSPFIGQPMAHRVFPGTTNPPPTGMSGTVTPAGNQLNWNIPNITTGLAGYVVYRNRVPITGIITTNSYLDTFDMSVFPNLSGVDYQVTAVYGYNETIRSNTTTVVNVLPPSTLTHTIFGNSVILRWTVPPTPHNNPRYNVYREVDGNRVLLTSTPLTVLQFSDNPPNGTITYSVHAVYPEGESNPRSIVIEMVAPIFEMDFDVSCFGDISVGSASAPRNIKISNTGGGTLSIFQMEFIDANPEDFKFVGIDPNADLPIAIEADKYIEFSITFNPTAEGERTASLWLIQNGFEVTTPVTGKGIAGLIVNPSAVDFGIVYTGAYATLPINVSASSAGSSITAIALAGNYANQFAVTHGTLPIALTPGTPATINVRYNPTTIGTRPMVLNITDNDSNVIPVQIAAKSISLLPAADLTLAKEGTSVNLAWKAPDMAAIDAVIGSRVLQGFNIYKNGTLLQKVDYNVVTHTDAAITNNTVYAYHVVALHKYDDTAEKPAAASNTVRLVTPPVSLEHTVNNNNVTLTWGHGATNATFTYRVYRRLASETENTLLTTTPISATTFAESSVPLGEYVYSLIAIVEGCESERANFPNVVSEDDRLAAIQRTEILGNFPNPFNPETTIHFTIENHVSVPVRIDIYNIRGQLVRTLIDEPKDRGFYNVVWNGRDDNNNQVGSGIYLYHFRAGDHQSTHRMLLMK